MRSGAALSSLVLIGLSAAEAHAVVLKTGRVIRGTLVTEDDKAYVIKNAGGIESTIYKKNVDLEKKARVAARSSNSD